MAISLDGREGNQDMVFIVPQNNNTLLLGGLVKPGQWDLNLTLENYPPIKAMYDRCLSFYEPLWTSDWFPVSHHVVGVRVEREPMGYYRGRWTKIVHSYSQGGAGFSLSFSCTADVANMVNEII
jgi:D-amino-acid oxidase